MKTVIITGANSGLGFETAKKIAQNKDYEIILACRNKERAEKAKDDIIKETQNENIKIMILDTSSLGSVRNFVDEFKKLNIKLNDLVCNAGISGMNRGITEEGFELVFATNYLGHFLLTNLLLPYMDKNAKIFNVSSDMHNPPGGIEWKDVEKIAYPKEGNRSKYSYSKLFNIYFTYELDRRLRLIKSRITVNAFNPGYMSATNFVKGKGSKFSDAMIKMMGRMGNLDKSSTALSELVTNINFNGITGKYFDRSTKYINSSELSYNEKNRLELWNKSIEYTKLKQNETIKEIMSLEY